MTDWPDCATTGCENKACTWGSEILCFKCEEKIVGLEEMRSRYNLTHQRPWNDPDQTSPNYMTKTFAAIREYVEWETTIEPGP